MATATDTDVFDDASIFSRTLWGEARGEGVPGMQAVANVIINRFKSGITWWEKRAATEDDTVRSICLFHCQFSCWNDSDPNRPKMLAVTSNDPAFASATQIAAAALAGDLVDHVNGATSYFDSRMPDPPDWAANHTPVATIGHHVFYRV